MPMIRIEFMMLPRVHLLVRLSLFQNAAPVVSATYFSIADDESSAWRSVVGFANRHGYSKGNGTIQRR